MPRISILTVPAGAGHGRAAAALADAARARGWQADVHDVLQDAPAPFRHAYLRGHLRIVETSPALWSVLYRATDRDRHGRWSQARCWLEDRCLSSALQRVDADPPDAVLCTHFLPAQAISRRIADGAWHRPVRVVVTDYDVHALWRHPGLSYAVANEDSAFRLRRHLPQASVTVTGIPVAAAIAAPPDRRQARQHLGLDPDRPVLLLLGGGLGLGELEALAPALLELDKAVQVVALCGRNETLRQRLAGLSARMLALPFTPTPEFALAAADLAIGKSGGLTVAECLATGLPLVAASPLPGQEERNAIHLLENGAGLMAYDVDGVLVRVQGLLRSPHRLQALSDAARALGRPQAADTVLDLVAGDLAARAA